MRRAAAIAVALVALFALAMPATGVAGKGKKAKITVNDDFYTKSKLKVKKNTKVTFKWNKFNLNTHNVTFKDGPKGIKKSRKPCSKGKIKKCNTSQSGSIGINFAPTFDQKGTYKFQCTIHPTTMQLKVVVKK